MTDDIIGTENIKTGKFIINNPQSGSFHYGVLCKNENEVIKITRGINITSDIITKGIDLISEKSDDNSNSIDFTEPVEKKYSSKKNNELDRIIRETYYKANYKLALKELKKFIKSTDNVYDKSKARLFLAKSYIELQEYETSIKLLDNDDVKTNFPEEMKFWFEFALVRLK